jgi:hypothetical protein
LRDDDDFAGVVVAHARGTMTFWKGLFVHFGVLLSSLSVTAGEIPGTPGLCPLLNSKPSAISRITGLIAEKVKSKTNELLPGRNLKGTENLPDDFWRNPLPSVRRIPSESEIEVISLIERALMEQPLGQTITPNREYEKWLVSECYGLRGAPEVFHARAFDSSGKVIGVSSKLFIGSRDSISIESALGALRTLRTSSEPYLIELSHTHPGYEFTYRHKGSDSLARISPLSAEDLAITQNLSFSSGVFIRIKAVLPNGYSYHATVKQGRWTSDPLWEAEQLRKAQAPVKTMTLEEAKAIVLHMRFDSQGISGLTEQEQKALKIMAEYQAAQPDVPMELTTKGTTASMSLQEAREIVQGLRYTPEGIEIPNERARKALEIMIEHQRHSPMEPIR